VEEDTQVLAPEPQTALGRDQKKGGFRQTVLLLVLGRATP
jgi:hypothetical protein